MPPTPSRHITVGLISRCCIAGFVMLLHEGTTRALVHSLATNKLMGGGHLCTPMQVRQHVFKSGPAEVRASAEGTSGGEHERWFLFGCLYVRFNAF